MGALTREDLGKALEELSSVLSRDISAQVCSYLRDDLKNADLRETRITKMTGSRTLDANFAKKRQKAFKSQLCRTILLEMGDNDGMTAAGSFLVESPKYNGERSIHDYQGAVSDDLRKSPKDRGTFVASFASDRGLYLTDESSTCPPGRVSVIAQNTPKKGTQNEPNDAASRDGTERENTYESSGVSPWKPQQSVSQSLVFPIFQDMPGSPTDRKSYMSLASDDFDSDRQRNTPWQEGASCRGNVLLLVKSSLFEHFIGLAVLANAICLGYDTEYMAMHRNGPPSPITVISEGVFCFLFTSELVLRVYAFRYRFFTMQSRHWNILDSCLVAIQLIEMCLKIMARSIPMNLGILRLLRILRIIRVTRLVRSFHLFDDLRVLVSSIMASASSLCWSVVLLFMLMYIFSLVFLQIILNAGETQHADEFAYWFGDLFRTFFTMFECIVGGVSWDEVASPLLSDLGPLVAWLFSLYIATSLFAMMNLLTGVFVDKAMKTVREDKDMVLARRIRDVFLSSDEEVSTAKQITWSDFQLKLDESALQDYFAQLNVEQAEARHLFELLDADGSGAIDAREIVDGCLKLRGPARALDLALLSKDIGELTNLVNQVQLDLKSLQG